MIDSRTKFIRELKRLKEAQPFTRTETKRYTTQQKSFIRGIQISRGIKKKDAIVLFKKSQKNKELTRGLSDDIARKYEKDIGYRPTSEDIVNQAIEGWGKRKPTEKQKKGKAEKGAVKGRKYKYAEKVKKADSETKKRYQSLGGKSRRYIDTYTGEEISRRERDKRLSE